MAIKILITLEGSEEVKSAIDGIAKRGEDMMSGFQKLGGGTQPLDDLSNRLQSLQPSFESSTRVSHGFAESLRVVIPALRLAGVEVGNFAGFSRLASAGLTGLAAAVTGAVIIAFANLEEQTKKLKAGLTGLFGSREVGGLAFSLLEQSAKDLGISVESLAPAFQSATTAFNRFQQASQKFKFVAINPKDLPIGNIEKTAEAVANLFKIIRAGGQDEDEAAKSAKAFFDALKEGGQLTTQVLDQLPEGAIRLLGRALGKGAESVEQLRAELALTPPTITKVIEALAKFGLQAQAAFDADAVKGFRGELNRVMREFSDDFRELVGINFSDFVIGEIKAIAAGIKTSIDEFKRIRDLITRTQPAADVREAAVAEAEKLKAVQPFKLSDIFTGIKDASKEAAQSASTDWNSFNNRFSQISNDVIDAGNKMLRNWEELKKKAQSTSEVQFKFVTPPAAGTNPFAAAAPITPAVTPVPAITPEQQATQTQNLVNPFQLADDQIRTIWIDLMDFISTAMNDVDLSGLTERLVQPFRDAVPGIIQVIDQVKQLIYELMLQIALAQAGIQNLGAFATGGQQGPRTFGYAASGGYIRGPGTTTSDSILAWLSDKEFVINAKAVSHYGADFFAALNSMRLPKDVFGQFNMGGLVDRLANSMPKLATGGMVPAMASSGTPITFIIDRQSFDLTASDNTVARLRRYAVASQLSSAGRKPSWVK